MAPWQLFFQQSNIVDKRITPRWIPYARHDLRIGIVVVMVGAVVLMAAAAAAFQGTAGFGSFADAGAVASGLSDRFGHTVGVLFAILLLDASLVGANAGRAGHHLHPWRYLQAAAFAAPVDPPSPTVLRRICSAAGDLGGDHVPARHGVGLLTLAVQALAGVLLPSATVFLVLLCNDRTVLGPWVNTTRQNIAAGSIVWVLVLLSLALTAATFFPGLSAGAYEVGFGVGVAIGVAGGGLIAWSRASSGGRRGLVDVGHLAADRGDLAHPGTGGLWTITGDVAATPSGTAHPARLSDRRGGDDRVQGGANRHR